MTGSMSVLKGTLDVLVLKALESAPMHGFEVTHWLERSSGQRLALEDAAIYQALYRLEGRGVLVSAWGVTENGRRARYYELTRAGRRELVEQTSQWVRYAATLTDILTAEPEAS
jgi:transcriptional regulator